MSHPAIKPAIWGAVVGAVAIMIAGFWGFGWVLGSTADRMAKDQSEAAVVVALTPVCVARFEAQTDAAAKLADLKKVSSSWDRGSFVEKGGWATVPGSGTPNSDVARACAEKLDKVA
jgi:hypothetical protein